MRIHKRDEFVPTGGGGGGTMVELYLGISRQSSLDEASEL